MNDLEEKLAHLSPAEFALLRKLIKNLKDKAIKVVIFGSRLEKKATEESDLDVFVMVPDTVKISEVLEYAKEGLDWEELAYLNLVVVKKNDFEKDPVFSKEVEKGILVWQRS